MLGTCRLNNKSMRAIRREASYQCMAIDLAMLGVISKEECEMLISSGIPRGIILPNGSVGNLISEKDLPKKDDDVSDDDVSDDDVSDDDVSDDDVSDDDVSDDDVSDDDVSDDDVSDDDVSDSEE